MATQEGEHHSPKEIGDYIARNYPELKGSTVGMSIGVTGGNYRVIVTDAQHVNHTLKIDPKEIDADLKKEAMAKGSPEKPDKDTVDRAKRLAADLKRAEKGHPHDRERDRER
jgi:hypothetical protein